jgi:diguanylate cyclase (GGDEF)-like protein/PAS domain S-box-containing protein
MRQRPNIGVLLPRVGGLFYASLLSGIQRAARERDAWVVAFQTVDLECLWPNERDTRPLGWDRIDGWIANDLQAAAYCEQIVAAGKPLVTVSTRIPGYPSCTVLPDNHDGVRAAVAHLVDHGHRRIAFAGALGLMDVRERYEGYITALRDAGIPLDSTLFFPTGSQLELDGRAVGRQLVAARLPCTAIVAGTDLNALGIMREVRHAGYRIPEDLAVIGFDDVELAQYSSPPLATMRVSFDVVSYTAAKLLLGKIIEGVALPEVVRIPATLVRRLSCGCVRRPDGAPWVSSGQGATEATDIEHLAQSMLGILAGGHTHRASLSNDVRPAAVALAAHLRSLARGQQGRSSNDIRDAWCAVLGVSHDVETVDALLTITDAAARAWTEAEGTSSARNPDIGFGLRNFRFELMRAWHVVEQARRQYSDANAEANRRINLALIGADYGSITELSWLKWARVRYGALGEWRMATAASPRVLCVTSVFAGGSDPLSLAGREFSPAEFPGPELCALLDEPGTANIVSVVAIPGRGRNRGLLVVVGPIEVEVTDDTGNLAQWAALLGAAMDREDLLASLRRAIERERDFAETLRRSEERYALAARGANDGLWDWDVVSGTVYFSPRWKSMLGLAEDDIDPHIDAWLARVHSDDIVLLRQALDAHVKGVISHIQHEYRIAHKDGHYAWVLCRGVVVFDSNGQAVRVAGSQTDITAHKEAEEQLRRNALHDALTGLPNRALLMDRLEQAIARAQRTESARFAVLFLDLDHFKTLNDSLGHLVGDQLLIQIANRLSACIRSIDTVARLGGDEFAIIVSDLDDDDTASQVAERIQESLRAPFEIGSHRIFTSASIGITLSSGEYERSEDFLRDADTAMYRAKSQGRARHQVFDGRMHEQAMARLSVEAGVRSALEREEFVLMYQPFVSLATGSVVGVEALVRWNHPEHGLLAPAAFLDIAEESGLIAAMSDWIMRVACEQASRWQRELLVPMRVNVNVPPAQLMDAQLVSHIQQHLDRSGLAPSGLGLELVESSLIENRAVVVGNLQSLRAMGIHISIDDFGTGYSSLSYLKRLPIDTLKIDRSFTQGIPHDTNDTAISTAIIAMAKSLNLSVIAEGVETAEQAEFLRAHDCDAAQGFFFSYPMPAEACLQFFRDTRRESRPPPPVLRSSLRPRTSSDPGSL